MADILGAFGTVTVDTLATARETYNGYRCGIEFRHAKIPPGVDKLGAIIRKYGLEPFLRLVYLHRHSTIPEGHIQLGKIIPGTCVWTGPTPIPTDAVDRQKFLQEIHAYVFSLDNCRPDKGSHARLVPSEFRVGPPANVGKIPAEFVEEFVACLWTNGWGNTYGLELRGAPAGKMTEFPFPPGNLLVRYEDVREEVRRQADSQVTRWIVVVTDGNVSIQADQDCLPLKNGDHFVPDGEDVRDLSDALEVLMKEGILAG